MKAGSLPLAVILAVPLALLGPVIALNGLGLANNLYTQIGLMLLIALAAKNAILIVEMAREHRMHRASPILDSAAEAARTRFRPILMTSFAFILGALPLVFATGAGANGRDLPRPLGGQRHDRVHLPGGPLRALLLRRAAALRGAQEAEAGQGNGAGAGGVLGRPALLFSLSRALKQGREVQFTLPGYHAGLPMVPANHSASVILPSPFLSSCFSKAR